MRNVDPEIITRAVGCRSEFEVAGFLGDIQVEGIRGLTTLRTAPDDADAKAKRYELIEQVRGGKHLELAVKARTFRQQKGKQNRRYLRLGGDLAERVPTFAKQPFLVDHNTWEQSSRKGTILSSSLIAETQTRDAFEMAFNAVKPDAVISVLDGTLDRFSIGWFSHGAVLCTVHGCDVRMADSCSCWPGDKVLVGDKVEIAEYEFTDWSGKELSGVNIPAVQHTNIEDIKAALAAELNLSHRIIPRTTIPILDNKENKMPFPRLAVALGLTALSEGDDERAFAAVEALKTRAATAETQLADTRGKLTQAESAVKTLTATAVGIQVDAILRAEGFGAGKLRQVRDEHGKLTVGPIEKWLRDMATTGGVEVLKQQLRDMPVIVPVGQRLQSEGAGEPELTNLGAGAQDDTLSETNPYLISAAEQTGQKVGDLVAFAKGHVQKEAR